MFSCFKTNFKTVIAESVKISWNSGRTFPDFITIFSLNCLVLISVYEKSYSSLLTVKNNFTPILITRTLADFRMKNLKEVFTRKKASFSA